MGKKRAKKKAPTAPLREKTKFKEDTAATASAKNIALGALLAGPWQTLEIVRIRRIEIGPRKGWEATYRQ